MTQYITQIIEHQGIPVAEYREEPDLIDLIFEQDTDDYLENECLSSSSNNELEVEEF